MEVDEVEAGLLERFSSLQTADQAELVRQVRRLVGGDEVLSEKSAIFYLEMSSWNVATAVGHFFDLQGSNASRLPSMSFVRDVTIGEGESVPPGTRFTKTWTVMNSGDEPWPEGCQLRLISGQPLEAETERLIVPPLDPRTELNLSLAMVSPQNPGMFESQWRMTTPKGDYFGDIIWMILTVEPSGTMALTQQLNNFHALGSSPNTITQSPVRTNPRNSFGFGSENSPQPNPFNRLPNRPTSPSDVIDQSPRQLLLARTSGHVSQPESMEQEDEFR